MLIKSLLLSGQRYEAEQEIVYADKLRYSYRTLNKRIRQMANVLTAAGVKAGDTVAMLDWDSHRYLECFFRGADDRRRAAYGEYSPVSGAGAVYDEPRGR
nr:hypothetical protein GCM10020185_00320 [Pseudomonas brassicacearum subsp. brassicacearum]